YHEPTTKELALSRLEAAMRALGEADPPVAEFVRHFTLVATVVTTDESSFSSGSTIQYVGRSMFCNAHLTAIDSAVLAEALVHEAIHSLLYMHELCEPWVRYEGLQDAIPIESPWTGSRLALRAFLHACFVWFGLVNFWTRAQRASIFPPRRIEEHLVMARTGSLNTRRVWSRKFWSWSARCKKMYCLAQLVFMPANEAPYPIFSVGNHS